MLWNCVFLFLIRKKNCDSIFLERMKEESYNRLIDWLIDWTLVIFQLCHGIHTIEYFFIDLLNFSNSSAILWPSYNSSIFLINLWRLQCNLVFFSHKQIWLQGFLFCNFNFFFLNMATVTRNKNFLKIAITSSVIIGKS